MHIVHPCCAGLDVHKKTVTACRYRVRPGGEVEKEVRTFGTMTPDLLQLVDWLNEWRVAQVAMESTGDYWKPVYNLLEGNLEVLLVNAQHVKHVPGRKTDVQDAEWLAELLSYGLLKGSFIPPKPQRELRDLTRYRVKLVQERSRVVHRVQKLLESANIKLSSVATDILGVSGRAILEELVRGQTDAAVMAELAKGRLRKKIPALQKALTGVVSDHHRFLLAQQLAHIDFLDEQIAELGAEIGRRMEAMSQEETDETPAPPPGGASGDEEGGPLRWEEAIELLCTIPGIERRSAEVILAEIGLDMSQFPDADHLASWAGLSPGNHQSGGKRYSGRTRQGNRTLRSTLSQVAWAASRKKGSYLSALYHRLASRRGKKRAIIAVAHSIIVSIHYMLVRREPYRDLGPEHFDKRKKERKVHWLLRQLEKLGYAVSLQPQGPVVQTATA